jgi:hypothetical protein
VKEIATCIGCHLSVIDRVVARAKGLPEFAIPGRKKGSGNHEPGVVRRQIQKNPISTAADLKKSCLELVNINEQTISYALQKQLNMPSIAAAMKPLLLAKMKKKRLQFRKNTRPGVLLTGPRSCTVMNQPFLH